MPLIRTINIAKYMEDRERFPSDCFKNLKGDISVFDRECAEAASGEVCRHIRVFYPSTVKTPPCYWEFTWDDLLAWFDGATKGEKKKPSAPTLKMYLSDSSGDKCHGGIVGLTDGRAKSYFGARADLDKITACSDEGERTFAAPEFAKAKADLLRSL